MKLMLAKCCMTLVVPSPNSDIARSCECGESWCWWINPERGLFATYSKTGKWDINLIGIHNKLLQLDGCSKETIQDILNKTSEDYLFKTVNSLTINVPIGTTNDTRFATKEEFEEKIIEKKVIEFK